MPVFRQTKDYEFSKLKRIRVLRATDIATRGIDIDNLAHVVNYELPDVPETQVRRRGRTGHAGAEGFNTPDRNHTAIIH